MHIFRKEQVIFLDDVPMRVERPINETEVQLSNVETGELCRHRSEDLLQAYEQGRLKTTADRTQELRGGVARKVDAARMSGMSPAAKVETHRRLDILVRLQNKGSFEKSRRDLCLDLREIAAARGEDRPPHVSTVFRWRRRFLRANRQVRALFVEFDKQGGPGRSRLHATVEAQIDEKIHTVFLAAKSVSASEVHGALALAIDAENTKRSPAEQLELPGLRTIQRRISQLYAYDRAVAQYGHREAERRFASHGRARAVTRILEIVEIDHTPVDLMVTDEARVVIGRPSFTVLLDRASRCVLGYHLSLAGHGVPAVFSALKHAILPKSYLKSEVYASLKLIWPCFGWPERILADNGLEFHAEPVRDALANLDILLEYAGSRDPNDKPHVERFLRTFNYNFIHKLPGTTLSHVHKRVGFKAEKEACLTLKELDQLIHNWICNVYHRKPHLGLDGRAPIDVWNQLAKAYPPQLKMNREELDIEFSEVSTCALQHYGIDLNTFTYASQRLALLRRVLPAGSKVTAKWPRDDVGHIWVWDTTNHEYFKVPNKEEEYAGLTLDQAKAAKKRKSEGSPDYRRTNAEARDVNREIVGDALKDKKLKMRRWGARHANQSSETFRDAGDQVMPEVPSEVAETDTAMEVKSKRETVRAKVVIEFPDDLEGDI